MGSGAAQAGSDKRGGGEEGSRLYKHVLGQAIEVLLLLRELLSEFQELLLLALADGVVLASLFASLKGVTAEDARLASLDDALGTAREQRQGRTLGRPSLGARRCLHRPWLGPWWKKWLGVDGGQPS